MGSGLQVIIHKPFCRWCRLFTPISVAAYVPEVSDLTWLPPPSPPSHPAPNPLSQFLPKELSDSLISFLGLDLPLLRSLSMIDENMLKEYPPHFFPTSPGGNVFYLFILRPST